MTRARETSENARQAKAWVNFDGTFGSSPFTLANGGIRGAFNVSSVTDNSAGNYTVNFTEAMSDTNYVISVTVGGTSGTALLRILDDVTARTASAFRLGTFSIASTFPSTDASQVNCAVFG